MPPWLKITPLGFPPVPDVYIMQAGEFLFKFEFLILSALMIEIPVYAHSTLSYFTNRLDSKPKEFKNSLAIWAMGIS